MSVKCIIHFQPIERYPPAFNLLRVLAERQKPGDKIFLITTAQANGRDKMAIPGVSIHRLFELNPGIHRIKRLLRYFQFIIVALIKLVKFRPETLLYYETASAGAAYFYTGFVKPSCKLFIHYHEYTSPSELQTGMLLYRWLHKLEKVMYKKAVWVSHTNQDRMDMFVRDEGLAAPVKRFIYPNYPPLSWQIDQPLWEGQVKVPVGLVYVGALSTNDFYLMEFAQWVAANATNCYWDIYSDNHTEEATSYLKQLNAPNIFFKGAVNYDQLPQVLPKYHVGLVLYNGAIPNQVYLVPNKLFEYYVCGLDTWFPTSLIGSRSLKTDQTFPKIVEIDFDTIDRYPILELVNRINCRYRKQSFSCESASSQILALM